MGPFDFNTNKANPFSTPMLPGQTNPTAPVVPSFSLPPLPVAASTPTPTPTVNVNLAPPTPASAVTSKAPTTPQVPAPTVEQTQANANFRSNLNLAVNSGNPTPGSVLSSPATPTTAMSSADKYYQDYLKQQKDFQNQVLTNMKPSAEETAIRTRLNEQKTTAALNRETALNSGETSSFAGGEAQRVARTDAIKTAGLEAQVQTLQDARKNSVDALQLLLNSGDKSFDALTKIETLKNSINSTDKNAIDTLNNLGQTYPDAKFTYDPQLSATENLALMKEAVVASPSWASKSGTQTGSAPFQATIDIAAGNESGIGASKRAAAQLANLASTGDYQSLLVALKQQALKGMPAADKTEVIKADKQILSADRMSNALQAYVAAGGDMNFLKGKSDDIATYFGKLAVDPKYKSLGVELKSAFQQYRVDMTGAAFGAAESADYASVVPTKDKELDLNLATLNGLKNYMTGKVDDAYTIALGEGYQNVKSLAQEKSLDVQAAQVINPDTNKPYTQQEIDAYKASKGIGGNQSFSKVGNTTASVTIPKTSNLAYVNNNPGNLRFAGQTGATQGQGGFAKFSSPEEGVKALNNQIALDASRGHTLASFINKFAPPTENNTAQYISQAIANLGVTKDTPLSKIPTDKLVKFIALKESSTKIS